MKKTTRTLLALILSAGIILSASACGKKKSTENSNDAGGTGSGATNASSTISQSKSGSIVKESDAYYNVYASELKVDLNKDKEIEYSDIASKCVVGDRIVGEVFISYKVPDDVQKELDRLDLTKDSDMDQYIKIYNEYQKREIILFDLDGNAINSIPLDDDCDFRNAYAGQNGEIMIATSHFDLKECASVPGLSSSLQKEKNSGISNFRPKTLCPICRSMCSITETFLWHPSENSISWIPREK